MTRFTLHFTTLIVIIAALAPAGYTMLALT